MKGKNYKNSKQLNQEEQALLNIYLIEYNDMFQNIYIQTPKEFIKSIIKRVELTLKKQFNDIPEKIRTKVEDYFSENIYAKDYKLASMAIKIVQKRLNEPNHQPNIFNGKIINHCNNDKKNNNYIHSCGEVFYTFKYKLNNYNNNENNNTELNDIFLICVKCEVIYKSNLVKFHCNLKKIDFYSKILANDKNNDCLPFATWKKYHCNAIINDTMKCKNCNENLYYNKEENKLICLKCKLSLDPKSIKWNCLICKKEFTSDVKEYNNLEFKNMKICVKDTLLNKIKAKPDKLLCGCNEDIKYLKFYHKNSCKGDIYIGEMNKQKIIVCAKCDSIGLYKTYSWTCPLCQKSFKINDNFLCTEPSKELKFRSKHGDYNIKKFERPETSNNIINNNILSSKKIIKRIPTEGKFIRKNMSKSPISNNNINRGMISRRLSNIDHNVIKRMKNEIEKLTDREYNSNNKEMNSNLKVKYKNSVSTNDSDKSSNSNNEEIKKLKFNNIEQEFVKIKNFNVDDYLVKNQIGEGSFGKIFLVESKDHKLYALKKIIAVTQKDIESLQHEYSILLELNKCNNKINLVEIYGIQSKKLDSTTYVLYVLMDLASTDWEKEVLKRQKKKMYYSEYELIKIIKDLVRTFSYLQKRNISHRDIKPQNILIFNGGEYKLADFGEAKELLNGYNNTNKQTLRGTELYMSPILFQALRSKTFLKYINHNSYKSDVFSFGLCCLFASTLSFQSLYDIRELKNNFLIREVVEIYLKKRYSNKIIDIICLMLEIDEKLRCDFIDLEQIIENI